MAKKGIIKTIEDGVKEVASEIGQEIEKVEEFIKPEAEKIETSVEENVKLTGEEIRKIEADVLAAVKKVKAYCFVYAGQVRSYVTHFMIDRHDAVIECIDNVVQTDDPILGEYIKDHIKDLGMEEIK